MESLEIHLQSDDDQVVEGTKEELSKNTAYEIEKIRSQKEAELKLFEKQFPLVSAKFSSLDLYKNVQGYMDSIDDTSVPLVLYLLNRKISIKNNII